MSNFHFASKVLNLIDTRPAIHEVKGAVKLDPNLLEYSSTMEEEGKFVKALLSAAQPTSMMPTTFAVFDKQNQSLTLFIEQICIQLGIINAAGNGNDANELGAHFALMFDDKKTFLTEQNKQNLQQGFILKLTATPDNYARYFLTKLCSSRRPLSTEQLSMFNSLCVDNAFAEAFHEQQGIQRLTNVIEEAADWHPFFDSSVYSEENGSGSLLLGLMHALLQLMQLYPQLVPWPSLSTQFVRKIAFLINGQSKLEQNDSRALALDMLLILIEFCEHLHECFKRELPVDSLIRHLENSDQRVLLGTIRLMNAIYALADREERIAIVKTLHERPFIAAMNRVLVRESSSNSRTSPPPVTEEKSQLWEQLARLQHIRFDEVRALALRAPSDKEINFLKTLEEFKTGKPSALEEIDFGADEENFYANIEQRQQTDWDKFSQMVRKTSPGLLAICAILDITQPTQTTMLSQEVTTTNHAWTKLQELDAHFIGRPSLFPQILAKLAEMLLNVLGICGDSSVGQRFGHSRLPHFWRLVLTCERPFYELFRVLVELFYRTWRDMNAKPDELDKVFSVVKDQLERAMVEDPESLAELEGEMLRKRFSYFNMQKIWKREQLEQEELELNSEDIQPLRDHLRPRFERLVLQKRICLLKKGLTFRRVLPANRQRKEGNSSSSPLAALSSSTAVHSSPVHSSGQLNLQQQPQYWFWRLDDRERHFQFWDCRLSGGKHTELMLETQEKLPIGQIRAVLHGPELVSRLSQQYGLKLHKKSQNILRCGFSIEVQSGSEEHFLCAQTEQELANWLEALNCLCWPQKALENVCLRAEVDRLLNLDLHIRLMDIPQLKEKPKAPDEQFPSDLSWIPRQRKAIT